MAATSIQCVGGDDVAEPFLITASDGAIADLTGSAVTAEIGWGPDPARIVLSVGDGIEIANPLPPLAAPGQPQAQHGFIILSRERSGMLPLNGGPASICLRVTFPNAERNSTSSRPLVRVR